MRVGFKVGRLKVIGYAGAETPDGPRRWRCVCACGRECTRSEHSLKNARNKGRLSACDTCSRYVRGGEVRGPKSQAEPVTGDGYEATRAAFTVAEEGEFTRIMARHNARRCDNCRKGQTRDCEREAVELVVLGRGEREGVAARVPAYERRDFSWQFRG